MSLIEFFSLIL